jgi:fermentation-respiration switch protein FrsA (DUF1100 family)
MRSNFSLGVSIAAAVVVALAGRASKYEVGGTNDKHTFPQSTQALFDAAQSPKERWLVPGAAHVDLYGFAPQEYAKRILAFVAKASSKI